MFARKGTMLDNKKAGKYQKRKNNKGKKGAEETEEVVEPLETNATDLDGPLYEKHKIAQAKDILQPFVLRRLKVNVGSYLLIFKLL